MKELFILKNRSNCAGWYQCPYKHNNTMVNDKFDATYMVNDNSDIPNRTSEHYVPAIYRGKELLA